MEVRDKITKELEVKYENLKENLREKGELVVAFSGGVDSTFLVKVAYDVLGEENVLAVTSRSETYPKKQLEEAKELAQNIGVKHIITYTSELENERFAQNDKLRCYYCKFELFSEVLRIAEDEGFKYVADGSNYDDHLHDYRPGMKAASELHVSSPLKEAEFTKDDIRVISKKLGLATWKKAAFACLSSRFPYGDEIKVESLTMVDKAEEFLQQYNFSQLRVRHHDENTARIEILPEDMVLLLEKREEIVNYLKGIGYIYVTMDIEGYRTGSMNEVLDV
ncbi:ATP-dependent sacrificial sulfur transferase LarE [Natronospora cellulosivora (SeqCode)]